AADDGAERKGRRREPPAIVFAIAGARCAEPAVPAPVDDVAAALEAIPPGIKAVSSGFIAVVPVKVAVPVLEPGPHPLPSRPIVLHECHGGGGFGHFRGHHRAGCRWGYAASRQRERQREAQKGGGFLSHNGSPSRQAFRQTNP